MYQTFKAKVTYLLQKKLEALDASDESSDMNPSEHFEQTFRCLRKTSNNTFRDSAKKIFKSIID